MSVNTITAYNGMRYVLIAGTTFAPSGLNTFVTPAASVTALSTEDCAYQAALANVQFFSFNMATSVCYGIAPTIGPFSDGSSIETATFDGTVSIPNSDFVGTFDLANVKQTEGLASRAQCQAQCLPASGCYIVDFSDPGGFCSFKAPTASAGWDSGWVVTLPASAKVGGHMATQGTLASPTISSKSASPSVTSFKGSGEGSMGGDSPANVSGVGVSSADKNQSMNSNSAASSSPSIGAIVGGVVGATVVVCAIAVACFVASKRKRDAQQKPANIVEQSHSYAPANKDGVEFLFSAEQEPSLVTPSESNAGSSSVTTSSLLDEKRSSLLDNAFSYPAAPRSRFVTTSDQRASILSSKLSEVAESSVQHANTTQSAGVNVAGLPSEPLAWTATEVDAFLVQNGINDETRGALKDVSGRILLWLTVPTLKDLYGISDRNQIVTLTYLVSKLNEVSGAGVGPVDHRVTVFTGSTAEEDAPPSYS
ncbi:hypothetical protein BC830DRAFT_1167726 [Chytriomyces sp. MP71]|nr:hypothetical protein BC830DRAFT_1167726 [Chytriomyces sp. MP71]